MAHFLELLCIFAVRRIGRQQIIHFLAEALNQPVDETLLQQVRRDEENERREEIGDEEEGGE